MAYLIALCLQNGDWDVVVMKRLTIGTAAPDVDILGKPLPPWQRIEARDGIGADDALRLAHQLKGIPKVERYKLFRKIAPDLRLCLSAKPDPAAFS